MSINVLHGNVGYFGTQAVGTLIVLVSARQGGQQGAQIVQDAIDELAEHVHSWRELSEDLNDDLGHSVDEAFAGEAAADRLIGTYGDVNDVRTDNEEVLA